MQIVKSLSEIASPAGFGGIGVTIGNFDGLHRGHQHFLESVRDKCRKSGISFVVMTFLPHPKQILFPEQKNYLINNYHDRRELLAGIGVDFLVEIDFTRDFSTLGPDVFMDNHLFVNSEIKKLFVGHDFAFGENKRGDHKFIESFCQKNGVEFEIEDEFTFDNIIISSTLIRDVINRGDVQYATKLLNRPYFLSGVVVKGMGRGRQMGFPTANIKFHRELIYPGKGTYITRTMCEGMMYNSITNVGYNPTFEGVEKIHIETNLFDFEKDIYGEKLKIYFLKKIRDEKKHASVNSLIRQIHNDVENAKKYFGET